MSSRRRSGQASCAYTFQRSGIAFLTSYSLKLKAIHRFTSTATAVEDITALQSGKLGKGLKTFIQDEVVAKGKTKEPLVVIEPKLGECPECPARGGH